MKKIYTTAEKFVEYLKKYQCVLRNNNGHLGYYSEKEPGTEVCYVFVDKDSIDIPEKQCVGKVYVATLEEYKQLINTKI